MARTRASTPLIQPEPRRRSLGGVEFVAECRHRPFNPLTLDLLDFHRGAVSEDFGHSFSKPGGVVPHADQASAPTLAACSSIRT